MPTIEEFEETLDVFLKGNTSYHLGQYIPDLQLARIMKVPPMKLESEFILKGTTRNLPQGYLWWFLH